MKDFEIYSPPIHSHYNEELQDSELCGRVFCPKGFIGVTQLTADLFKTIPHIEDTDCECFKCSLKNV